MIIHLRDTNILDTIQCSARKINELGISNISLVQDGWDLESCWSFWLGYKDSKGKCKIKFPVLSKEENKELANRIRVIGWVRSITNLPAEELSPENLAYEAAKLISDITGNDVCSFDIITGDELVTQGYFGLHAVGRSSNRIPAFLSLDFNPSGSRNEPVQTCLVGKGITFDSGGYSLKQHIHMESMKSDMGGASLVTGALALAILRGLKSRVKLFLCCADNMIDGSALRPGDIIRYRNGKSVEVLNTDAEGRLVLADGLIRASEHKPSLLVNAATLTGAAKVALGNEYQATFTFDEMLSTSIITSAYQEQELFWRLPLSDDHRKTISSNFADISNLSSTSLGSASSAAAFLSHFVNRYQHGWIHIDCSASYRKVKSDKWPVGATGIGVRTLANLIMSYD
jgi:PepB aminopeptidase